MTNEQKKISVGKIIALVLLIAITVAAYTLTQLIFGEGSVFNTTVSENDFVQTLYEKVPTVIRTIQIITIAIVINILLKLLMTKTASINNRGITVVKLLNSFIKWIVGIVALLLILGAWGVDTATLIASAGILSLVVGLGAQSLVADIIAGLFIVIEGEYQVGDIVVIDNWRGTVKEIGIRTTKIEDAGGNIKIINNSGITSIVNQTQALSVAKATMSIEYGESIPRVELVIQENLDKIRERIPAIIDGPFYKGVTALSASSVDLLFLANCHESDIYSVQRALNRELKLMFDENNINIPFPQVVVNQPENNEHKTTAAAAKKARAFVAEQTEISKNVEEKPE